MKKNLPKPPRHLQLATRKWWSSVVADYELEPHHLRLLTLAAESWDRCQQARQAIAEHGLTFEDKHDQPRLRPEVDIEHKASIRFARLIRELSLDIEPPAEVRLPRLAGTGS